MPMDMALGLNCRWSIHKEVNSDNHMSYAAMFCIAFNDNFRKICKGHMQKPPLLYLLLSLIFVLPMSSVSAQKSTKYSIESLQQLGLEANGLVQAARSQVGIAC